MGVASWSFVVWAVWVWAGRGACSRGRPGDCTVVHCCVGLVGRLVLGVENTPAAARLGGGGCPRVVWGWHAVGVLGQCALVA